MFTLLLPADTYWERAWFFQCAPKSWLVKEPVYLPPKQNNVVEDLTSITLPLFLHHALWYIRKKKDICSERLNDGVA